MTTREPLTVGTELGGYRIEAPVGRGGMGEVFRALDNRLGRYVALKVLVPHLADDDRFRERFLRESRLAASIDHPNVIPIYEAGEVEDRLFIAMRFVEGADLRQVLDEEGSLEPARALGYVAPVAGALDAAHSRGLVHRDVKPANVLIAREPDADPPEHVYLSDFGLTTATSATGEDRPFSGTADYAAPELVAGGTVDGRADVYALGCVLFECLTATLPFQGDSAMAVLWGHVNDPVPAASGRNSALPPAVDGVFEKALAKDPKRRYGSCRQLVEGARDALGVAGIEVPRAARSRRLLLATAVTLGLAAVGLLAFFLTRGGGGTEASAAGAIVRIDPATNKVTGSASVGEGASAVSAAGERVWAAAYADGSLWLVNPGTLGVTKIPAQGPPVDLALYGDKAYVAADGRTAFSANVTAYEAGNGRKLDGVELFSCVGSITAGAEGVWATPCPKVQRVSFTPKPRIAATVDIPYPSPHDAAHDLSTINDVALWKGSLWAIGDAADRRLWQIDARAARIRRSIPLPFPPLHVAAGEGAVWVTDQLGDAVARINPLTGRIATTIRVGRGASGVAVGAGSVWTTSFLDGTVSRIDPRTNRVVAVIPVRGSPRDVAVGAGSVWATGDGT